MQDKGPDPSWVAEEMIGNARSVYDDLGRALSRSLNTLDEDSETLRDATLRQQIMQVHANTLLQLIEIEVDLEGRNADATDGKPTELDLDAARREVFERLSRSAE